MTIWIIYFLVLIILSFVLNIALQGVKRGIKAKNKNKKGIIREK
tara:strand:+ start:334 stop:465 length:132 start_codon:yes stop_codon:yes gene_type:complete